jgi:hypothetical protein
MGRLAAPDSRSRLASVNAVGAGNSSGHAEQAFRPTRSDPSRCRPSALSWLEPRRTSGSLKPRILRNSSIRGSTRQTIARGAGRFSDGTIRVDRAVPEIHHTMTATRAKPQLSGPDEFSAPTGADPAKILGHSSESGNSS